MRQPQWDKYESAILLDGYLEVLEKKMPRTRIVRRVSNDLRQMAINRGLEIDEIFRNENGISFQMSSMESAYVGFTVRKPATGLFCDVVALYKNSRPEFDKLLVEAKAMVGKKINEEQFMTWLSERVSPAKLSNLYVAYQEIERHCLKMKVIKKPLFETTDLPTVTSVQKAVCENKLFTWFHRGRMKEITSAVQYYYTFLKELQTTQKNKQGPAEEAFCANSPADNVMEDIPLKEENADTQVVTESGDDETEGQFEFRIRTETDKALSKKYPVLFRDVAHILHHQTASGSKGLTVEEILADLGQSYRKSTIQTILSEASWSKELRDGIYRYSEDVVEHLINLDAKTVDFSNIENLAHTRPAKVLYFGDDIKAAPSWIDAYTRIVSALYEDYPSFIPVGKSFIGAKRVDFGDRDLARSMISPKAVSNEMYLETNCSATTIATKIKALLDICNVDYENLVIQYCAKDSATTFLASAFQDSEKNARFRDTEEEYRTQFVNWMKRNNMASATISSYISAIGQCAKIAQENGICDSPLLIVTDANRLKEIKEALFAVPSFETYNAQQHNRFLSAYNKLISFRLEDSEAICSIACPNSTTIQDGSATLVQESTSKPYSTFTQEVDRERFDKILRDNFEEGLVLNAIRLDKFRILYEDEFESELTQDDDLLTEQLKEVGFCIDDRVYPRQDKEQSGLLGEIRTRVLKTLNAGACCVDIRCVMERWQQDLAEQLSIYNEATLRGALLSDGMPGVYASNQVFKLTSDEVEPQKDVLEYMKVSHTPVSCGQLKEVLWYLPIDTIKFALMEAPSIAQVDGETYLYAPNFPASQAELYQLTQVMQAGIDQKGFLVSKDIARIINEKCPTIAINTEGYKDWAYRNILKYILRDKFEFGYSVVSAKGQKLEMWQVYRNFCRDHEHLTLNELKQFSNEVGVQIYWDNVLSEMVRINANELVRKDLIHFDVDATDRVLEDMCSGDYLLMQDVKLFLHFPAVEHPWNIFMLECYLQHSRKFVLYHTNYSDSGVYGMLVRRNCALKDYRSVVIDMLANSSEWNDAEEALALVVEKGCQARKRLAGLDEVVREAGLIREQLFQEGK